MARKLGRRGVVAAVRPGRLFFISDSTSQRRYLVDTGSAFSIMPWQSSAPPSGPSLSGADGRRIPCWGERPFTVTIGGVPRQWQFLMAAVSFPILGVDFLRHHALVVDVANLRLFSPTPVVGPGAAVQGSTEVKAPSGSSVPPATARPPPFSVVGTVTPRVAEPEPAGAETFGWSRSQYTEVSAPAPGSDSRLRLQGKLK